ncbi:hypothetical protein FHS95_001662 [Sphingomonas naasensis]|uniref:Barstar (barnase inhibitor) domain-containing protein n=1 Tax=Sphingomonas naasensis TaxID=1344951 RepID=A0A4V3QVB2_9SPHN|nr:hypothetical protein [Sphingomonas naasensis]NIJ19993.1 hypothetical protein [Sphingomonas naasensis]TGX37942.1 hypothetical protein E5A74_19440 [Sphingomonas naasensis]
MRTLTFDCGGIESEDAFWDALHGGPGWPDGVKRIFANAESLRHPIDGAFSHHLQEIARDQNLVPIEFC